MLWFTGVHIEQPFILLRSISYTGNVYIYYFAVKQINGNLGNFKSFRIWNQPIEKYEFFVWIGAARIASIFREWGCQLAAW